MPHVTAGEPSCNMRGPPALMSLPHYHEADRSQSKRLGSFIKALGFDCCKRGSAVWCFGAFACASLNILPSIALVIDS